MVKTRYTCWYQNQDGSKKTSGDIANWVEQNATGYPLRTSTHWQNLKLMAICHCYRSSAIEEKENFQEPLILVAQRNGFLMCEGDMSHYIYPLKIIRLPSDSDCYWWSLIDPLSNLQAFYLQQYDQSRWIATTFQLVILHQSTSSLLLTSVNCVVVNISSMPNNNNSSHIF